MKKVLVLLFLMVLVLPVAYSLSASIGNAKAILRINASPEDPAIIERTLLVNNKNDIPVKIALKADEDLENFVDIKDKEFVLQPAESKKAEFTLTIDRGGLIQGKILVNFRPEDPESKENSVGLASSLIIISEGPIIEDEEVEEVAEEAVEVAQEEPAATDNEEEAESEPVTISLGGSGEPPEDSGEKETKNQSQSGSSPLVGIVVMLVIIALGGAVFFAVLKALNAK